MNSLGFPGKCRCFQNGQRLANRSHAPKILCSTDTAKFMIFFFLTTLKVSTFSLGISDLSPLGEFTEKLHNLRRSSMSFVATNDQLIDAPFLVVGYGTNG